MKSVETSSLQVIEGIILVSSLVACSFSLRSQVAENDKAASYDFEYKALYILVLRGMCLITLCQMIGRLFK